MRQKLLTVSQLLMHGSLARCFQAWQQDTQVCYLPPPHNILLRHAAALITPYSECIKHLAAPTVNQVNVAAQNAWQGKLLNECV